MAEPLFLDDLASDVIDIPHADTRGVFVGDRHASAVADPRAVFSVLQFGAVIPPLTMRKGARRLLPGRRYMSTHEPGTPRQVQAVERPPSLDGQADAIEKAIDATLQDVERPVILFSGGVDSALVAARAAALGKRGTVLVNYSFGENDPESRHAARVASALGLAFERVSAGGEPLTTCLEEPGKDYPFPFGGLSTVPVSELARAVVRRVDRDAVIFDGAGADCGFGLAPKVVQWQRMMKVPRPARRAAGAIYRHGWRGSGRLERASRMARRSVAMPPLPAIAAQNALGGVLYDDSSASEVYLMLQECVHDWTGGPSLLRQVIGTDIVLTAYIEAQKARPIFDRAGIEARFPFLSEGLISMALSWCEQSVGEDPKASLKWALRRHLPAELIYRNKSGLTDPRNRIFKDPVFLGYLREAMSGPVSGALHLRRVAEIYDDLCGGKTLPGPTLNVVWSIVFLDRWLRTAQ